MDAAGTSVNEIKEAAKLLGLADRFDEKDIRQAYNAYARRWHPDMAVKRGVSEQEASDRMIKGNKAYAIVKDAVSKNGGTYSVKEPPSQKQTAGKQEEGKTEKPKATTYWDVQEQRWKTDPTGKKSGWYDRSQDDAQQGNGQQYGGDYATAYATESNPSPAPSSASTSIFEDMVDSVVEPISDVAFKRESFPAKVLHVFLTLIQMATVARIALGALSAAIPPQCSSLDEIIGYLLTHLLSVAIGVIGSILGGFVSLWLARVVSRFAMRRANAHVVVAVILDAIVILWTAKSLMPFVPVEIATRIQDAITGFATNLGM